ncbi:MAG: hypothetical protein IJ736_04185, partial [Firmicutes bacterium]|nr:hypothetical protein [Bacillota bacterium]
MELYFEKLSNFDRVKEVCSLGVPFERGVLDDADKIRISDGENDYPLQARETARWDDGSLKWVYVTFFADLPKNADKRYYLHIDGEKNDEKIDIKE